MMKFRPVFPLLALLATSARATLEDHAQSDVFAAEAAALVQPWVPTPAMAVTAEQRRTLGEWGGVIPWTPHIPVSAANLPDGRILTFASNQRTTFPGGVEFTYAATWNPATGAFVEYNHPTHDMFCGALTMLEDGRVVVNGGRNTVVRSSIFDYRTNQWTRIQDMNDPRWYNTAVALPGDYVWTVSGSGGTSTAERWAAGTGWTRQTGVNWGTVFTEPGYIKEWHPQILLAQDGRLFHFGPTDTMHWIGATGTGSLTNAGVTVPGAQYPKEGCFAMFNEGRILVAGGGSSSASGSDTTTSGSSTKAAYLVDLRGASPAVTSAAPMAYARQFANSVVLPNGEVMVIGGNTGGVKFSDAGSILTPEIWNPVTGQWRAAAPMVTPRNYHSLALLLADGRVLSGGGGLSGNSADHRDAEIYTPPALFNTDGTAAARPVISSGPAKITPGYSFSVTASPDVTRFTLIKMSSITHSMNTDLRFLEPAFRTVSPGQYSLSAHSNINVLTPGYWMLFALNSVGAHSVAKVIQVTSADAPQIADPGAPTNLQGDSVRLAMNHAGPAAPVWSAAGLPAGLSIHADSGVISGVVSGEPGPYAVIVTAAAGTGSIQRSFTWWIAGRGQIFREVFTGIAGLNVADLTAAAAYPSNPASAELLTSFESPTDSADNYGQRLRGYVHPPVTGSYRFAIAADDTAVLFLSPSENPAAAVLIATVPSWTAPRAWTTHAAQQSALITLEAGKKYYIEARMKEATGGDNLAVAWDMPGSARAVIAGSYLSPYLPYVRPSSLWSMEQSSWNGTAGEAADSGPAARHGAAAGGAATEVAMPALSGNPGTGRYGVFNGTTRRLTVPWHAALTPGDFTLAGWVKVDAVTSAQQAVAVNRTSVSGAARLGYGLFAGADGKWAFFTGSSTTNAWTGISGGTVTPGAWTYVAATFRTTGVSGAVRTGVRRLYVNGVMVAEGTATLQHTADQPLVIGAADAAAPTLHFKGALDEIRLHPEPLSPRDIALAMEARQKLNEAPTLITPGDSAGTVGAVVFRQLIGSDAENDTLTFSAEGLPPGLALDPASGVISGALTTPGSHTVTAGVADSGHEAVTATFTWTVNPALIVSAPVAAPAPAGSAVSLTAATSGGTASAIRYRWNFGDGSPDTGWFTSPSVTHTFPAPGRYVITVTVTDDTGRESSVSFRQGAHAPLTSVKPTATTSILWEPRAAGNARVWVVNPDNDSVAVFDAVTRARLAEISVGAGPRTLALAPNGRVWVACLESADLRVIDPASLTVLNTLPLPRGTRPYGVIFDPAGAAAWVSMEAGTDLWKLHPVTGAVLAVIPVGPDVRHLSATVDGARILASRFVTPALPGEETAAVLTNVGAEENGGEVLVISAAANAVMNKVILRHSEEPDTSLSGRGVPNYLGAAVISPDNTSVRVPSKQDNIKRGQLRDGQLLTHDMGVRAVTSRIDPASWTEVVGGRLDHDNAGQPSAAAFDPTGLYLFTALEGSREIAVTDAWAGREILRIPTGRAVQGMTISPDGRTLWARNFMDRTVTLHDLTDLANGGEMPIPTAATLATVSAERLAPEVFRGKQMFYDSSDEGLSLHEYISCASCHNDGGHDGRTWDFTQFGEGLRNTTTLRGHGGPDGGRLHWTGNFDEVQDFEGQIRGFSGGLGLMSDADFHAGTRAEPLGDAKAGRSADLDALAAYVNSLQSHGLSPQRASAALPAAAAEGRRIFKELNCASCHAGNALTDSASALRHDVGTLKAASGQRLGGALDGLDTPTLRGLWNTAPYLHDGSAPRIEAAIAAHTTLAVTPAQQASLARYLEQLDDETAAPAAPLSVILANAGAAPDGTLRITVTLGTAAAADFSADDLEITNGYLTALTGTAPVFTASVLPLTPGLVTIAVPAAAMTDADGDPSAAATPLSVEDSANRDGDDAPNLLEYALGGDAARGDSPPAPRMHADGAIRFSRPSGLTDLTWSLETSATLRADSWSPLAVDPVVTPAGGGVENVAYPDARGAAGFTQRGFYRIRVALGPVSAATVPFGFQTLPVPRGNSAWTAGLTGGPLFTGVVTARNGRALTLNSSFPPNALSGCYAELLTEGTTRGWIADLASHTADTITLAADEAVFPVGSRIRIRPHATLATLFPNGAGFAPLSDSVTLHDASGKKKLHYWNPSASRWIDVLGNHTGTAVIRPGAGFLIQSGAARILEIGGDGFLSWPKSGPTRVTLVPAKNNWTGPLTPLGGTMPLSATGFSGGMRPLNDSLSLYRSDGLLGRLATCLWTGAKYVAGDGSDFSPTQLPAGSAHNLNTGVPAAVFLPNALPYSEP